MTEADIMRRLMKLATNLGARLFRNNTAQAWVGEVRRNKDGSITLKNPRPLHAGLCVGSSDCIGFTPITITQDMVGDRIAIFTAVEVKTATGRPTQEQKDFLAMVRKFGGLAGIARNDEDLTTILCPPSFGAQGVDKIPTMRNGSNAAVLPPRSSPE